MGYRSTNKIHHAALRQAIRCWNLLALPYILYGFGIWRNICLKKYVIRTQLQKPIPQYILTLYQTIGTFVRLILETDIYSYTLVHTFLIVKNFNVELFYSPYIYNTAILNLAVRTFVLLSFFIRPSVLSAPPVRCRMHNDRTVSPFSSLLLPTHKLKQIMGYKSSG